MKKSRMCQLNTRLNKLVGEFIRHVKGVGEESISDYLVWQWCRLDPFMKHYRISQSNRVQEHFLTGADFKIELWNVQKNGGRALSIQAKKCIDLYGSYRQSFRYGDPEKDQIDLLINHAVNNKPKMQPCYVIYTNPQNGECTKDGNYHIQDYGAFIANAYDIEIFSDSPRGSKISRKDILKVCYPLHYIFCFSEQCFSDNLMLPFFEEKIAKEDFPSYIKAALLNESKEHIEQCMIESGFKPNDILLIHSMDQYP